MPKYEYNTAGRPEWTSPGIIPDCFSHHGGDVRSSASISNFSVGIGNDDHISQTPEWISPAIIPVCSNYQEEHVRNPSHYNPASNSIFSGITDNYHNNNSVHPSRILDRGNRSMTGPGNISPEPASMTNGGFGDRFSESIDPNGGSGSKFDESIDESSGSSISQLNAVGMKTHSGRVCQRHIQIGW